MTANVGASSHQGTALPRRHRSPWMEALDVAGEFLGSGRGGTARRPDPRRNQSTKTRKAQWSAGFPAPPLPPACVPSGFGRERNAGWYRRCPHCSMDAKRCGRCDVALVAMTAFGSARDGARVVSTTVAPGVQIDAINILKSGDCGQDETDGFGASTVLPAARGDSSDDVHIASSVTARASIGSASARLVIRWCQRSCVERAQCGADADRCRAWPRSSTIGPNCPVFGSLTRHCAD